jgi:hypothetical protein
MSLERHVGRNRYVEDRSHPYLRAIVHTHSINLRAVIVQYLARAFEAKQQCNAEV